MEEEKELILSLKFDTEEGLKRAANFRSAIDADKEALAALNKVIKTGGELNQQQLLDREKLEQNIKKNTKARKDEIFSIDSYIKATKDAIGENGRYNGSINNLRGSLSFLTAKYNDLTEAERENVEVGVKMQKEIKRLSDALKMKEGALGNNTRSVGGYQEAIEKAISGNSKFSDGVRMAKEGLKEIVDISGNVIKSIKGVADAEGTAQKASLGLGLSLKAIGIGLLIAAIAGVVSYLSKFEDGMEKVEQATSGVGAAVDVVLGSLGRFGEKLVSTFTSPIESAKRLGEFLKLAFTDPKEALETLKNKSKEYQVDLIELAGKAITAGKAMAELTKRTQELEDAQTAAQVQDEKQRGQIENLLLKTKERTLSEKERLAGLKEAGKIEQELYNRRLGFAEEEARIALAKDALDRKNGKLSADISEQAAAAQVKLIQVQNEGAETRQRIANRESGFILELNQQKAERIKANEEKINKALQDAAELRILRSAENSKEELEAKVAALETDREIQLKALNLTETEKLLITERFNKAKLDLLQKFTLSALAQAKKEADENLKIQDAFLKELEAQRTDADKKAATGRLNRLANNLITQQQYDDEELAAQLDQQTRLREDLLKKNQDTVDIDYQLAQTRVEIKQRETEKKIAIQQTEYQAAVDITNGIASLVEIIGQQSAEGLEFQKALTLVNIGISTAEAISTGIAKAQAEPFPLNLIAMTTTIAAVLANIAKAKQLMSEEDTPKAPKIPRAKYAMGTVLEGPSHSEGGIQIYSPNGHHFGEAEGGEPILTAGVSKNPVLLSMASIINQMAGGRALAPSTYMAAGGLITKGMFKSGNSLGIDYDLLASKMAQANKSLPKPVVYTIPTENKRHLDKTYAKEANAGLGVKQKVA